MCENIKQKDADSSQRLEQREFLDAIETFVIKAFGLLQ